MRFPFAGRRASVPFVPLVPLALVLVAAQACGEDAPPPAMAPPTVSAPLQSSLPVPDSGFLAIDAQVAPVDAGPALSPQDAIQAAVNAPDRDDKDKALDKGRHPAEMLSFFGIAPGMKVAELVSATGYTTELLARTVGPTGVVWGENPAFILDKFAAIPWSTRLGKPVMANVRRMDRDLDSPFSPDATNLDAVVMVLFYHDTVWLKVDRAKMNKAVFDALKSGGIYGIEDHAARAGAGTSAAQTLHRIEEKTVIDEVTKAGFRLAAQGDFLKNPNDKHDWNASPMSAADKRGTSDRFILKFVKP